MRELRYGRRDGLILVSVVAIVSSAVMVGAMVSSVLNAEPLDFNRAQPYIIALLLCLLYYCFKNRNKWRLMITGIRHDAKAVSVVPEQASDASYIAIALGWLFWWMPGPKNRYMNPFRVKVSYWGDYGGEFTATSELLYYDIAIYPKDLTARVWVNPKNSDDKYIQLFLKRKRK